MNSGRGGITGKNKDLNLNVKDALWSHIRQGSPTSKLQTGTSGQISGGIRLKWTISAMCLNHPETIPPSLVHRKIAFHEIGPWGQKGWGPLA